ncbi:GNAT family N-acetyltransferase [Microbacterium sp. VKM Ac-2870]|uniref:GNAT family N-acetyltransferase n=1 Tax=Microbacterium sp. VKM Ac-2870 TaxID=2783825 RepID=UPI00188BB6C3|nr:GNAT family N-acetyltransferase [Microbacterium sp. VKM Ac-2870]MBF4562328.1 GNAT family N-acetyltransferase [Microbacterium sp. VKM Ac-2870]
MSAGIVEIRPLETVAQMDAASAVLSEVWGGDRTGMPANLLRALAHAGNYAVGLYDGEQMIGASVGFLATPEELSLHSHITGIVAGFRGQGLGRMLKQHQREWALTRGIGRITWTFDPLVARNAAFNLRAVGARVSEYLIDHYGAMDDGVNRGDETDRLFVTWHLNGSVATPPQERDIVTTVEVPGDIERLRREAPGEALDWRYRVREAFLGLTEDGFVVGGFDDRGYLFVRS